MTFWNKLRMWALRHKLLSVLLIILALVIFGLLAIASSVSLNSVRTSKSILQPLSTNRGLNFNLGLSQRTSQSFQENYTESEAGAEIEVKEANFTVDSNDVEVEVNLVRKMSSTYQGYIERSNKRETSTALKTTVTVRIPVNNFEQFINELQQSFNIKNYTISNYRIPIQRELDELDILRRALEDYSKARKEISAMSVGEEKIRLLMETTKAELDLKQREKNFERSLTGKKRQGEFATVVLNLEQKVKAELWPENIGNKFRDGFKRALESILDSFVSLSTGSIALFFKVIEWLIYALIIIIPTLVVYKILKRLHRRYWFKENPKKKN